MRQVFAPDVRLPVVIVAVIRELAQLCARQLGRLRSTHSPWSESCVGEQAALRCGGLAHWKGARREHSLCSNSCRDTNPPGRLLSVKFGLCPCISISFGGIVFAGDDAAAPGLVLRGLSVGCWWHCGWWLLQQLLLTPARRHVFVVSDAEHKHVAGE